MPSRPHNDKHMKTDLKKSEHSQSLDNPYFLQEVGQYLEEQGINTVEDLERLFEPSFYVVLPVSVLERRDISVTSKVVYAEICALARRSGYCYASNAHLAEKTGTSERSVTRSVAQLSERNMIAIQFSSCSKGVARNILIQHDRVAKLARRSRQIGERGVAKLARVENLNTEKSNTAAKAAEGIPAPPFNAEETRQKWYDGEKLDFQLLAWFFDQKLLWKKFDSREKVEHAVSRHIRSCRRIINAGWSQAECDKAAVLLKQNEKLRSEWTLETLEKYLTK